MLSVIQVWRFLSLKSHAKMLFILLKRVFLFSTAASLLTAAASNDHKANAEAGLTTLQEWYNTNTGLWNTTGWWNSANCLTTIGDLAAVDSSVKTIVTKVFSNTFVQAQKYNLQMTKIVKSDFNIETIDGPLASDELRQLAVTNPEGFLNGFYDDEGWWALGWIQAYDVTGNLDYLNMAVSIFNDMRNGTEPKCGGGIWWDKANTYVNAIANELYLSVAAHVANRVSYQKQTYVNIATKQWIWFQQSGMINSRNLINDGLNMADCENNNGTVWSYNQGVILGALVELNKVAPSYTYLTIANNIAKAAIKALSSSNGVLHDPCEPNCGADGAQFKGVFLRNLRILQVASPNNAYLSFIAANAANIWKSDRNSNNQLSVVWDGPFIAPANASTQSSALDALVAAAAFQGMLVNGITS